jgi:hypothetical protein
MVKSVSKQTECPVAALALRVGTLWLAHAQAEENEHEKDTVEQNEIIPAQINELRRATEELASFERARSLAGALFQLALAHEAASLLYEEFPSESPMVTSTFLRLNRLLESAAMVLRDELGAEYEPFREVISTYIEIEEGCEQRALHSIEKIPALADEYRGSKKATA